jgi:hypothetical protein
VLKQLGSSKIFAKRTKGIIGHSPELPKLCGKSRLIQRRRRIAEL